MTYRGKGNLGRSGVPWITRDGFVDLAAVPLDGILRHAVSEDEEQFRSSCRILANVYAAGRAEGAIVLYGLLINNGQRLERKEAIVEALRDVRTKECAELLFEELGRIRSSNSTRRYIDAILDCLRRFPVETIRDGFEQLLADKRWSYRMKNKFQAILDDGAFSRS